MSEINAERMEAKQNSATNFKIQKVLGKLNMQWSTKEDGHCLHGDWFSLARSVGLSEADLPWLKMWVMQNNKKIPMRKAVKNKPEQL